MSRSTKKSDETTEWLVRKKVCISRELFKFGILGVLPQASLSEHLRRPSAISTSTDTTESWDKKIQIANRNLRIYDQKRNIGIPSRTIRAINRPLKILTELYSYYVLKEHSSLDAILSQPNSDIFLSNPKRSDEVFVPIVFTRDNDPAGFYVYPWTSQKGKLDLSSFSGFEHYVTAGCLFGSGLEGLDDYGNSSKLIKHNAKFYSNQRIVKILYDNEELHPYETMHFFEFEKWMELLSAFSNKEKPAQLLYHLPYFDYILYGVELLVRGRITLEALKDFFDAIIQRAEIHIEKINAICEKFAVVVKIESPFKNAFGEFEDYTDQKIIKSLEKLAEKDIDIKTQRVKMILSRLSLEYMEYSIIDDEDTEKRNEVERMFILPCLDLLLENKVDKKHCSVWRDFGNLQINSLEDLFKTANAIMVALATQGQGPNKTCSILEIGEKQIQVEYEKRINSLSLESATNYSNVINLSYLNSISNYAPNVGLPEGNMFYYRDAVPLASMLSKTHCLEHACRNVGLFATGQEPESLDVIANKKIISPRSTESAFL